MPAATCQKLCESIISWRDKMQLSIPEIMQLSGCSRATVFRILRTRPKQFNHPTNQLVRPAGRKRILEARDLLYIQSLLHARPTLYLDELRDELWRQRNVYLSISTICRTVRRLALTNKTISKEASERDDLLRAIWQVEIGRYSPEQFVFIDEAGIDDHTFVRHNGWAGLGRPCIVRAAFLRGQKLSILPALSASGILALDLVEGAVNGDIFVNFVQHDLVCITVTSTLQTTN